MINDYTTNTNVIIITLDSCRWDTFERADSKNIKKICNFRKAHSQGTYTYPSHMSIFSGILPDVRAREPYYNRFCKNLFRISGRKTEVDSYIEFPKGTLNIVNGFEALGYMTIGSGALEWFKHPNLSGLFQDFYFSGINLKSQIEFASSKIAQAKDPFFLFLNIGETHDPYEFGKAVPATLNSRARMRSFSNVGFIEEDFNKQIKAVEYVDSLLGPFFSNISDSFDKTMVVLCGDHGECFGEDGLYGHGFYHPKVMEVPLGIFEI